jgi:hypothetical protein
MAYTIFYAWQSDSPETTNEEFIYKVLKRVKRKLNKDPEIQSILGGEVVEVDRDTEGIPGSPHVAGAIWNKIEKCSIFVPDFTIVGKSFSGNRSVQNPNVLVEYGYALKTVFSSERIVAVMNTSYGGPGESSLPFDMRYLRWPVCNYKLSENAVAKDLEREKRRLSDALFKQFKLIIQSSGLSMREPAESVSTEPLYKAKDPIVDMEIAFGSVVRLVLPDDPPLFLNIRSLKVSDEPIFETAKDALDAIGSNFLPPMGFFGSSSYEKGRNERGAITYIFDDAYATNLTQLTKTGEIYGIDLLTVGGLRDGWEKRGVKYIPAVQLEMVFVTALKRYMHFIDNGLRTSPPWEFYAGVKQISGFKIYKEGYLPFPESSFRGQSTESDIGWKGRITDSNANPYALLIPFFELIWKTFGLSRPGAEIEKKLKQDSFLAPLIP